MEVMTMAKRTVGQWTQKNEEFTCTLKSGLVRKGKGYKELMRRTGRCQSVIHERYRHPEKITVGELREFIQEADLSKEDVLKLLFKDT